MMFFEQQICILENLHIRMISEASCDWSNDAENSALNHKNKLKLQAVMEGTLHPAHRQPVASERLGTVSNMH